MIRRRGTDARSGDRGTADSANGGARAFDVDALVVSSPCTVSWDSMRGDDVRRYCGQCRLHVYDLSQMTRRQIRRLLVETDGNVCKRIWRRPDGRVITKDCRRVVRAMRRRLHAIGAAAAALLALVGLAGCGSESSPAGTGGGETTTTAPSSPETPATPKAPDAPEPDATVATGR